MVEDSINIQMRLASVSEVSFMMSPAKVADDFDPEKLTIGFSSQIHPDLDHDRFILVLGTRYDLEGERVLESIYSFAFEVKNLKDFIITNDNQSITVKHIMPHFLNVAIGTMRGVLVVKTAGSVLAKYPLPLVDVIQLNSQLSSPRPIPE